jgi:hypothetical protein
MSAPSVCLIAPIASTWARIGPAALSAGRRAGVEGTSGRFSAVLGPLTPLL